MRIEAIRDVPIPPIVRFQIDLTAEETRILIELVEEASYSRWAPFQKRTEDPKAIFVRKFLSSYREAKK